MNADNKDPVRRYGDNPSGHLRYVSNLPLHPALAGFDRHLVIPAIILEQPQIRIGRPALEAGTRIAWTAYSCPKIPTDGKVLYKWPPDKS